MAKDIFLLSEDSKKSAKRNVELNYGTPAPLAQFLEPDAPTDYVVVGVIHAEGRVPKKENGETKYVGNGELEGYDLYVASVDQSLSGFIKSGTPLGDAKYIVRVGVSDLPSVLLNRIGEFEPGASFPPPFDVAQHFETVFTLDISDCVGELGTTKGDFRVYLRSLKFDGQLIEKEKKELLQAAFQSANVTLSE